MHGQAGPSVAVGAYRHAPAPAVPAAQQQPVPNAAAAQRLQSPQASAMEAHDDEEDMDEERELAEAARQAAKLCRSTSQRHQVQLPHGWDLSQAVAALTPLGVSPVEAEQALLATVESAKGWEDWMNDALFWIAAQHETDGEAAKLREAMQESLQAAEQERAAAAPLTALPEAKLRERFSHCVLLKKLQSACSSSVLFGEPLKEPLLAMLELEHKCVHKWYQRSGAAGFFESFADACLAEVHSTSSTARASPEPEAAKQAPCPEPEPSTFRRSTRSSSRANSTGPDEGSETLQRPAKRSRRGQSMEPARPAAAALPTVAEAAAPAATAAGTAAVPAAASAQMAAPHPQESQAATAQRPPGSCGRAEEPPAADGSFVAAPDHPAVARLVTSLSAKAQEIQDAIAVMPEVCGQVPELFRAATPVADGDGEDGGFCVMLEGQEAEKALAKQRSKEAAEAAAAAAAAASAAAQQPAAAGPAAAMQQAGPSGFAAGQAATFHQLLQQQLQLQLQHQWQQQQQHLQQQQQQLQQQAAPLQQHAVSFDQQQQALLMQLLQQQQPMMAPPQQHMQQRPAVPQQPQPQQHQPMAPPSARAMAPAKRGRGRPKGSRAQAMPPPASAMQTLQAQPRRHSQEVEVISLLD